jgi:hypothetical protein
MFSLEVKMVGRCGLTVCTASLGAVTASQDSVSTDFLGCSTCYLRPMTGCVD